MTTSPLSDTARRLLLVKCAAADQQPETTVPTVCSSGISSVTAPRATDPSLLPQLHVEEGTNSEWLVISRLLYRILTMILVLSIIIITIGSLLFQRSMDLWSILACAYCLIFAVLSFSFSPLHCLACCLFSLSFPTSCSSWSFHGAVHA